MLGLLAWSVLDEGFDPVFLIPAVLGLVLLYCGITGRDPQGVVDVEASERFLELADPSTPLPPGPVDPVAVPQARSAGDALRREGPSSTSK
jgi:hypothetical protein